MVKAINDARDDGRMRAIVIRVDSPGGTSYASNVIWHAIEVAKQKKPVVISMGDVAASGGYYISAPANRIIAEPSTITGSIGVYVGKMVINGFYDWIGVSAVYLTRGKNAGIFRETDPFSPSEKAKLEESIRTFYYDDFVPKVAEGRKRDREYIDSIGQGRVWTGVQAKERGLVDEFGGLDRAVEVAKELAKIPADKSVRRVVFPAPRTFLEQLFGGEVEDSLKAWKQQEGLKSLPEEMRRAFRYTAMFSRIKRGEMMLLMPFELRIE